MAAEVVPLVSVTWPTHTRIIPSKFPTINFFEKIVAAEQMEAAFYLESLTNDRLREEVGDINFVKKEDRISGKGASVVMAAFTHIGKPSRFSNGNYGVYYASKHLKTAIKETMHHRALFLSYTKELPGFIDMRAYVGKTVKPLHDVRHTIYQHLHHPENYVPAQQFASFLRERQSYGLVYRSVRDPRGECIAAFRPTAVTIPIPSKHLLYEWDGDDIIGVYEKTQVLSNFKRNASFSLID